MSDKITYIRLVATYELPGDVSSEEDIAAFVEGSKREIMESSEIAPESVKYMGADNGEGVPIRADRVREGMRIRLPHRQHFEKIERVAGSRNEGQLRLEVSYGGVDLLPDDLVYVNAGDID